MVCFAAVRLQGLFGRTGSTPAAAAEPAGGGRSPAVVATGSLERRAAVGRVELVGDITVPEWLKRRDVPTENHHESLGAGPHLNVICAP